MPDFRSTIRAALGERSVYWLAKESGVPRTTVREFLAGAKITSDHLQSLAATLGLTLRKAREKSPS